jgi:hypothetical protein
MLCRAKEKCGGHCELLQGFRLFLAAGRSAMAFWFVCSTIFAQKKVVVLLYMIVM